MYTHMYICIYIYIYFNALRAYPATVSAAQYPFCGLSPDVFSSDLFAACLQNLKCLCTILYCNVSPGVFNELCMHCRGELCHFFSEARLSLSFSLKIWR